MNKESTRESDEDSIHASVAAEAEEEETRQESLACSPIVHKVVSESEEVQIITDDVSQEPNEEQDS